MSRLCSNHAHGITSVGQWQLERTLTTTPPWIWLALVSQVLIVAAALAMRRRGRTPDTQSLQTTWIIRLVDRPEDANFRGACHNVRRHQIASRYLALVNHRHVDGCLESGAALSW
jgi:hypothetical protein